MKGLLLVNLGSPKSTKVEDVREYLDEFLMDERVIDYPWFPRALLVKGIILNTRPKKSAEAYRTVWTSEGSPLIVISRQLQAQIQAQLDIPVGLAMRYAEPSIKTGIQELVAQGVSQITIFPLYPQYAMSTTETVVEKVKEVIRDTPEFHHLELNYVPPFYQDPRYIKILAESIREKLPSDIDMLQFSYHGVPERHIFKTCPFEGNICLKDNCCTQAYRACHPVCYRHQCLKTTDLVRQSLGLGEDQVIVTFQSRLGKDKWIEPYTDATLEALPKRGIKKLAIVCPAFVSDCLETLEEISEEGKEIFLHAGGERFDYIPCLNDRQDFINYLIQLSAPHLQALGSPVAQSLPVV